MNAKGWTASAAAIAAASLFLIGPAHAADADGDTRPCVTHKEYRLIKTDAAGEGANGTTLTRVQRIFDSKGKQVPGGEDGWFYMRWHVCTSRTGNVTLTLNANFPTPRTIAKQARW